MHECEARKAITDMEPVRFDAAEATALQAGTPAFQSHSPLGVVPSIRWDLDGSMSKRFYRP